MAAEIERNLISIRTKEALARLKAAGVKLGRPAGKPGKLKLPGHEAEIQSLLAEKVTKSEIARRFGVSRKTVITFVKKQQAYPFSA